MNLLSSLRGSSRPGVLAGAGLLALGVIGGGAAVAATTADAPQPAITTFTPRTERQVTNIDVLRQQLRNYYGDPLNTGVTPADSNYGKEAAGVAASGARYLARPHHTKRTKAILMDVDDSTLNTWNYEVFSNFAFNPATN